MNNEHSESINQLPLRRRATPQGFALLEMVIALALLSAGILTLAGIFATGTQTAHLGADMSEDAVTCQSKMEALRTLNFNDTSTDTTQVNAENQFPTTGGTGLATGGSIVSPVAGYADYLDSSGNELGAPTNAVYTRMWLISTTIGASASSKSISVRCKDDTGASSILTPDVTLTTEISQ